MRHLPRADGLPVPAHTDATEARSDSIFATISPYRFLVFTAAMRCGLCAGPMSPQSTSLKAGIIITPGDVEPVAVKREEIVPVEEGLMHPHCLMYAAFACPALSNPDWVLRHQSNMESKQKEVGQRRGVSWLCVSPFATVSLYETGFPITSLGGPVTAYPLPFTDEPPSFIPGKADGVARRLVEATEADLVVGAAVFLEMVSATGWPVTVLATAKALRAGPSGFVAERVIKAMLRTVDLADSDPDGRPNPVSPAVRAAIGNSL